MVKEQSRLLSLIESGFAALRILIIGDVMLDRSIWGDVDQSLRKRRSRCCARCARPAPPGVRPTWP